MATERLDESICGRDDDTPTVINHNAQEDYFKHADPLKDNLKLVERGRLDRKTGMYIPLSSKGQTITQQNLLPSENYLRNFDLIKWHN